MIQITTLRWVPPFIHGFVKDLCVRWALEEIGVSYTVKLVGPEDQKSNKYREQQPFGQVPVYEEEGLILFESGSILLHIGEKSEKILPTEKRAKGRATTWVFAALNSIEPIVQNYNQTKGASATETWAKERLPAVENSLRIRLKSLDSWLQGKEYLEKQFTIGDIMMTQILRNAADSPPFAECANLNRYLKLCESRPAFQKALNDQLRSLAANAPKMNI
jgi:glutathione S-transferase